MTQATTTLTAAILILALGAPLAAEPYEVRYDPEAPLGSYSGLAEVTGPYPEDQGWVRYFGSADDVQRSIEDGALKLEAHEVGDWDTYSGEMDNRLDPEPGEYLYIEWRMVVDDESFPGDTIMTAALDEYGGDFTLNLGMVHVRDAEGGEWYWYDPGVFHTYLVLSVNLVDYDLYVDGEYAFSDVFKLPTSLNSFVNWGDGATTYSTSRWEYFRFGVARLGDVNRDGHVNLTDFSTFAVCFGVSVDAPWPSCSQLSAAQSDLDGDGTVDLADFSTFAVNFGR